MTSIDHHEFELFSFPPLGHTPENRSITPRRAEPDSTVPRILPEEISPKGSDARTPLSGSNTTLFKSQVVQTRSDPTSNAPSRKRGIQPLDNVAGGVSRFFPSTQPITTLNAPSAEATRFLAQSHSEAALTSIEQHVPTDVDKLQSSPGNLATATQVSNAWSHAELAIDPALEQESNCSGPSPFSVTQDSSKADGGHLSPLPSTTGMQNGQMGPVKTSIAQSNTPPPKASSEGVSDSPFDLFTNDNEYDLSRQSSSTSSSSFVGHSNSADALNRADGIEAGGNDVPPPKPKKSHARKQPEGHIKRARNAFILFRKHITDSGLIPPSVEVKHQNISVVAAKMWREAPQEVRQKFQEQARIEKEEHQRKYPGYRYQPVFRRTDIIRRRVRKDPAEDEKVEAVAEALIQGKHGDQLEEEIRNQMQERAKSFTSPQPETKTSRRRRREVGQLSKGALRAQRAQNRAHQIRQNLLGSSLLNLQLYNQNQQILNGGPAGPGRGVFQHPGAQHMQYTHLAAAEVANGQAPDHRPFVPIGYGFDGRPIVSYYGQEMYSNDTQYHAPGLPVEIGPIGLDRIPIQEVGMGLDGSAPREMSHPQWGPDGLDYWNVGPPPGQEGFPMSHDNLAQQNVAVQNYDESPYLEPEPYRLPLQVEGGAFHVSHPEDLIKEQLNRDFGHCAAGSEGRNGAGRENIGAGGQQTPSNDVMFSERLFDGALGSAMFPREDVLGDFGEAASQVNVLDAW